MHRVIAFAAAFIVTACGPGGLEPDCNWYPDRDGDGFGDASATPRCEPGTEIRHVREHTDCDDLDPNSHPGATERCDPAGADEDCDGLANDLDDDAEGGEQSWPDEDGDGFGDAYAPAIRTCEIPPGRSTNPSDCDDSDPATFVGAAFHDDPTACATDRDLACTRSLPAVPSVTLAPTPARLGQEILLTLPGEAHVDRLEIHDAAGRRVTTVPARTTGRVGVVALRVDGLAPGVYTVVAGDARRRLVLVP